MNATLNRINRLGADGCLQLADLLRRYPIHASSLLFRKELEIPFPRFPNIAHDSLLIGHWQASLLLLIKATAAQVLPIRSRRLTEAG